MNQPDRVLMRRGARELTEEEIKRVPAGLGTKTKCTFAPTVGARDGDAQLGEC
jgi:hypothetical protein